MTMVMLAAGSGDRLGFAPFKHTAKVLLRFGGKSLLQYHIEIFQRLGIDELVLGVGHHHEDIEQKIATLGAQNYVLTVFNEHYKEGNIFT